MKQCLFLVFLLGQLCIFMQEKLSISSIFQEKVFKIQKPLSWKNIGEDRYSYLTQKGDSSCIYKNTYLKEEQDSILFCTRDFIIEDYQLNAAENKILLSNQTENIYRRSTKANYYWVDLKNKKTLPLTDFAKGKISFPEFSKDGDKIAFVRENNLYLSDFQEEIQITDKGEKNKIINGMLDWVYEEEFSITKGFYWANSGKFLAYYQVNESQVKEFSLEKTGDIYPTYRTFKYPKAGEENSKIDLYIYALDEKKAKKINLLTPEEYIPYIFWDKKDRLIFLQINRLQNKLSFYTSTWGAEKILPSKIWFTEENKQYINLSNTYYYTPENTLLLSSEKKGTRQIYAIEPEQNQTVLLTTLKNQTEHAEVQKILALDEKNHGLYYLVSSRNGLENELWKLDLRNKKTEKIDLPTGHHQVTFSKDAQYFYHTFSTANTPPISSIRYATGQLVQTLEDNTALSEKMKDHAFSNLSFFSIPLKPNLTLNAWMIKPKNWDENKKYPVLMYVYGGPGSNTVLNQWMGNNYFWFQYLANQGYIIVSVDGRGTGGRGEAFSKITYQKLGEYETQDQIAGAKYLAQLPYIDPERIGIFGWSFGGYLSSLCLMKGADIFKAAIAVAPVTHWKLYNTIYTERYLKKPQDNKSGYEDNSPLNFTHLISKEASKGKFLLIHGTGDDNVHAQNTWLLTEKLTQEGIPFDLMIYPNENHGIRSTNKIQYHIYQKMTGFIQNNL